MSTHTLRTPPLAAPRSQQPRRIDADTLARALRGIVLALNDAQFDLRLCGVLARPTDRPAVRAGMRRCGRLARDLQKPLVLLLSVTESRGTLRGMARRTLLSAHARLVPSVASERLAAFTRHSLARVLRRYDALLAQPLPSPLARLLETQRATLRPLLSGWGRSRAA